MILESSDVGSGDPPIVFLHGLGGDHHSFDPQLTTFSPAHRCIAWTMPGYGSSTPLDELTFPALAECAASLIEDDLGRPAVVVGQSMGGMIAQELALTRPDLVDRLVLVATTAAFGRPGSSFNRAFLEARLAPLDQGATPADLAAEVVAGLLGDDPDPSARPAAERSMGRIDPDAYRNALACLVTWDARDRLGALDRPTTCIAGAHDRTAPVEAMLRLADLIAGARLVVIEAAGHLVNLEQPAAFDRALRDALT